MDDDPGKLLELARAHMDRGHFKDAGPLLDQFRKFPEEVWSDEDTFNYHLLSARELASQNRFVEAAKHCLIAIRTSEEQGDDRVRAEIMRWLGYIHWRKGDFQMAKVYIEEGLDRMKHFEDRFLEGCLRIEMGNILNSLGVIDGAAAEFRKAIDLLEHIDDADVDLSRAYNNLGDYHLVRGEWEEALELFENVKELATDNIKSQAWSAMNMAYALVELDRLEEASRELDLAIPNFEKAGVMTGLMYAFQVKGHLHGRSGEWSEATEALERARSMACDSAMPVEEGKIIMSMGRVLKWKGDKEGAGQMFREARAVFKEHEAITFKELVEKEISDL